MEERYIDEAIAKFEEYNKLHINEYVSDFSEMDVDKKRDNYIGEDIFKDHIWEWLQFFDEEHQIVFLELLKRYRYYTENKLRKVFIELVKYIEGNWGEGLDWNTVFFITFPSKEGIQSGGDVLRSFFEISMIGRIKKDNFIADIYMNKQRIIDEGKVVIIFDDVIGTGKTMFGNIQRIYDELDLYKHPDKKVILAFICANESIIQKKIKGLNKKGIFADCFIYEKMNKCFCNTDGIFEKDLAKKYREIVRIYEKIIQEKKLDDSDKNFVLGYDKSEFLLSFFYNTPNNTLSNFWRPSSVSIPLFIRSSYVRPKIDLMKEQKIRNQENGYEMRRMEKRCDESE